jgi:hypothetical protein
LVDGVASGRCSNLSYARPCSITVGHQSTSASGIGVDGVRGRSAVGRLIGGTHSRLLDVIGDSGVQVGNLMSIIMAHVGMNHLYMNIESQSVLG